MPRECRNQTERSVPENRPAERKDAPEKDAAEREDAQRGTRRAQGCAEEGRAERKDTPEKAQQSGGCPKRDAAERKDTPEKGAVEKQDLMTVGQNRRAKQGSGGKTAAENRKALHQQWFLS
ncbi:MAG: hypothetical protein ACLURV_04710 [Gallintestinimicrobium sp.]